MGKDSEPSYVLGAGIVIPIVCISFTALRFRIRYKQKANVGIDDWLVVPALFLVVSCSICLIIGVALRVMGYPTPPLDDPSQPKTSSNYNIQVISKLEWAVITMQPTALGLTKLSFLYFYRRVFVTGAKTRDSFDILISVAIFIVASWTIAYLFTNIFICKGHWAALWTNLETLTTQCVKTSKMLLSLAISDFLTHLMVILLPVHKILRLRLTLKRKLAVLAVFALGAVTIAMSVMRLYVFAWGTRVSFIDKDLDNNLLITRVLYWSVLEEGLALVACCLPTISPFLRATYDASIRRFNSSSSLRSLVARLPRGSGSRNKRNIGGDGFFENSSATYLHNVGDAQLESQAFKNTDDVGDLQAPQGAIIVDKSFAQSEQRK